MEPILRERAVQLTDDAPPARKDPAVFERVLGAVADAYPLFLRPPSGFASAVHVHKHEARGVPDLIGKSAIAFGTRLIEGDVGARRSHGGEGEARRVGAVFLDDLD